MKVFLSILLFLSSFYCSLVRATDENVSDICLQVARKFSTTLSSKTDVYFLNFHNKNIKLFIFDSKIIEKENKLQSLQLDYFHHGKNQNNKSTATLTNFRENRNGSCTMEISSREEELVSIRTDHSVIHFGLKDGSIITPGSFSSIKLIPISSIELYNRGLNVFSSK